jgi:hypothetical protein
VAKAERRDRVDFIAKYFKESTKTHGGYAINFFLCEVNCNKNKKTTKICINLIVNITNTKINLTIKQRGS